MSIYNKCARFDQSHALTEAEMQAQAPSIFAVTAHASRSQQFRPIPTIEILRCLKKEGFVPVGVRQSASRSLDKAHFTKHLIRLRHVDDGKTYHVGDNLCEILLKNANDGTSPYELMAGLYRIRCMNSLVTQTGNIDAIRVRHSGDAAQKVIEGTYRVLEEAETTLLAPQQWSQILLNQDEKDVLAHGAHALRFADNAGETQTPIKPQQLLQPRRSSDQADDLWTVWNIVQENSLKGGLRGLTLDKSGCQRRMKSRAIHNIDQDIRLNKALWLLGEKMAELKVHA